ncbi:hypothetical protein L6R29_06090 [Myxococcota bacterium]|nr:hypothetical protein [Myxococcota bacterium]
MTLSLEPPRTRGFLPNASFLFVSECLFARQRQTQQEGNGHRIARHIGFDGCCVCALPNKVSHQVKSSKLPTFRSLRT